MRASRLSAFLAGVVVLTALAFAFGYAIAQEPTWLLNGSEKARLELRTCIATEGINNCCRQWHAYVDAIWKPHQLGEGRYNGGFCSYRLS